MDAITLFAIIFTVICFAPFTIVRFRHLHRKNAQPYFVEPHPVYGAIVLLVIWAVVTVVMAQYNVTNDLVIMIVYIAAAAIPLNIYMLNASFRYKRIVEYNTAEWKRLRQKKKK